MKQPSCKQVAYLQVIVFSACLMPCWRLGFAAMFGLFGPDPVADIIETTGIWALNLLMVTLAITPLRKIMGWNWLMRLRRILALYSFFYACLHFLAYLVFEQYFDWREILKDIGFRPYITFGFAAFFLMVPLALTSTNAMMKRLGGRNWKILHRLTYVIAMCAVLHYFWLVKRDISVPAYYTLALLWLFAARWTKPSGRKSQGPAGCSPRGLSQ